MSNGSKISYLKCIETRINFILRDSYKGLEVKPLDYDLRNTKTA